MNAKNIGKKCETIKGYTYKCPCVMTSDDHKELKIMQNDI